MNPRPPSNNNKDLLRYASIGTQMLVLIAAGVFIGLKADKWLKTSPLLACIVPLVVLCGMFYKIYRETGGNKNT